MVIKIWAGAQLGQNSHISSLQNKYDVQSLVCDVFSCMFSFFSALFLVLDVFENTEPWKNKEEKKKSAKQGPEHTNLNRNDDTI